ncbi:MAG: insulinase family protein, partial [Spirochaetes bacterium]
MIQLSHLTNTIPVVTENIPSFDSIALGLWVKVGSRDETKDERGITHFIEHLLFKGTKKRTALDIAKEIDSVGGIINAFTSKEYS